MRTAVSENYKHSQFPSPLTFPISPSFKLMNVVCKVGDICSTVHEHGGHLSCDGEHITEGSRAIMISGFSQFTLIGFPRYPHTDKLKWKRRTAMMGTVFKAKDS